MYFSDGFLFCLKIGENWYILTQAYTIHGACKSFNVWSVYTHAQWDRNKSHVCLRKKSTKGACG